MRHATDRPEERRAAPDYPATLLERPELAQDGVTYDAGGARTLLPWSAVLWAIAAEVGEPEGVRTIVFDLLTRRPRAGYRVMRLDADPGCDAMDLAQAIEAGIGPERKPPSVRCLATDGIPARWYPDLESFEENALPELRELTAGIIRPGP